MFARLVLGNGFSGGSREAGALRQARFLHTVGNTGAGGTNIRVARERIPVFGHRLATASANAGVHTRLLEKTPAIELMAEPLFWRTMV